MFFFVGKVCRPTITDVRQKQAQLRILVEGYEQGDTRKSPALTPSEHNVPVSFARRRYFRFAVVGSLPPHVPQISGRLLEAFQPDFSYCPLSRLDIGYKISREPPQIANEVGPGNVPELPKRMGWSTVDRNELQRSILVSTHKQYRTILPHIFIEEGGAD